MKTNNLILYFLLFYFHLISSLELPFGNDKEIDIAELTPLIKDFELPNVSYECENNYKNLKINELVKRDPFSLKTVKKKVNLISILSDDDKKLAIVEYDNESMLVSKGDLIGLKWKVISIDDKEIILESLKTKKTKMVLLNHD